MMSKGLYAPMLYYSSPVMLPDADAACRIFRRKTGRLKVTACSNPKVGNLHVLAHRQGNVVAGEAFRRLTTSKKLKTYIATQAAISRRKTR